MQFVDPHLPLRGELFGNNSTLSGEGVNSGGLRPPPSEEVEPNTESTGETTSAPK